MSIEHNILYNMYNNGDVKKDDMATYITYDGQYKFELKRENSQLWFTDTSYKYKCIINIYDNITNNLLVSLNCSEIDIKNILDCYTEMHDYEVQNIICPGLNPYNSNGNFYMIQMELYRINPILNIMEDISSRWFNILEYNPAIDSIVTVLSIQMDCSEIEQLMYTIYFIFRIDI